MLASVLSRQGTEYRFINKLLPRMLRANYSLDYLLATAKKEAIR